MRLVKAFVLFVVFILALVFLLKDELFKEEKKQELKKVEKVEKKEPKKDYPIAKNGFPKEYFEMKATKAKQKYFFNFLNPLIINANKKILKEREFIKSVMKRETPLKDNSYEKQYLKKLAKKYRVKDINNLDELLKKADIVPPSMALAQAAVESGWGMSRFVKLANNIFGHWTYGEKGIIPLNRTEGLKHKIRIFDSIEDSVAAYMLNLNRNSAYKSFRDVRLRLRDENKDLSGLILSQTMLNYSGIKEKYLAILENMILNNNLISYDENYFKTLNKGK